MPCSTIMPPSGGKAAPPQIPTKLLQERVPGAVTPEPFEDIFQNSEKAFFQEASKHGNLLAWAGVLQMVRLRLWVRHETAIGNRIGRNPRWLTSSKGYSL